LMERASARRAGRTDVTAATHVVTTAIQPLASTGLAAPGWKLIAGGRGGRRNGR
jgi:hypothetical protein